MLHNINEYQYLFLGGIMGEVLTLPFVGNYLRENKKLLVSQGVSSENITFKTLSSLSSADKNSLKLANLLNDLYKKNNKKIVIMAHSKACLESLLCITNEFDSVKNTIQKVVCISPPFRGSTLFTKRDNHWMDKLSYGFLKATKSVVSGVECLTPDHYTNHFQTRINENLELKSFIKDNLLVIKGYKESFSDVSWVIKPTYSLLRLAGEDNDGLVTLANQEIPDVDYTSITLNMDHSDIFTSSNISNRDDDYRLAYMKAIINFSINDECLFSLFDLPYAQPHSDNSKSFDEILI